MSTVTRVLKAEIVRPVDGDWDALGTKLRALRAPLHRVLNSTVLDLELAHRQEDKVHPRTLSYRSVCAKWQSEIDDAAERAKKKGASSLNERIANTPPHSNVMLGVAGKVYTGWQKYNKARWKGSERPPWSRENPPLCVSNSGKPIKLAAEDGVTVLRFPLLGKKAPKHDRSAAVALAVEGGSAHAQVRWLLDHPDAIGTIEILQKKGRDRHKKGERKWKWFVHIAYSHEVEPRKGDRVMAVHRSVHNFVTVSVSRSDPSARDARTWIMESGADIVAHRRKHDAVRRSIQRKCQRSPGQGARGRGRKRRFEAVTRQEGKHARYVANKCKQVAAEVVRVAKEHGVGTIMLEDWSNPITPDICELDYVEHFVRTFPLAQCKAAIEWAAQREGFAVKIVPGQYNSRDCPKCGHRHDEPQPHHFMCANCRLERPVDVVAAWNMLRHEGFGVPLDEAVEAEKKAARRLKEASQ